MSKECLDITSSTVQTIPAMATHTSFYTNQKFRLSKNRYKYFEVEIDDGWETDVGIYFGNIDTSKYIYDTGTTGLIYLINKLQCTAVIHAWTLGYSYLYHGSIIKSEYSNTTPYPCPDLNASPPTRLGFKANSDEIQFYVNKKLSGTLSFAKYSVPSYPVFNKTSYRNKDLRLAISGEDNTYGGAARAYFDPSLWTTNPEENMIPLKTSFADEYTDDTSYILKQY